MTDRTEDQPATEPMTQRDARSTVGRRDLRRRSVGLLLGAAAMVAALVGACSTAASPSPAAVVSAAPTTAASVAPSTAPATLTPTPDACAVANLKLIAPGKLTVGTDNPAYPPYYAPKDGGNTEPWDKDQGDPNSGKGFESAVAYAVAKQLGFAPTDVSWVVVPFGNSIIPGVKTYDFDINQIGYTADRAASVDLTDGYYFGNQSIVALKSNPISKATTISELAGATLGAQVGTTSYKAITDVIKPTKEAKVYDTNDAAIQALKTKAIDAIVVDLPTADFLTNVEIENSTIVGQLDQGTPEHFSLGLTKGSPLTACLNTAIAALTADGTLKSLAEQYLPFTTSTPVLKP
jgi:polar amino acid transport system substrate-binding protein